MTRTILAEKRILGGLWGVATGDALGVPVEFVDRARLQQSPVREFLGHGTHDQKPGTWSDDTSLTLCTVETLLGSGEDYSALARSFVRWLDGEIWTPFGLVFDVGSTTAAAINRLARKIPPLEAGGADESDNSNGSLMRMLPVALWLAVNGRQRILESARKFSALTHRHPRAQMACGVYCLIAQRLLDGEDVVSAIDGAWNDASAYFSAWPFASEVVAYRRIHPARALKELRADEVHSSPYVVHTLEASLWCLLTTDTFDEAVLKAVNLGDDTDSTGAITGGLAGIFYGEEGVPAKWRDVLARHDDLEGLFHAFATRLSRA